MLFNRAYINELKARIEFLEKDIESKENSICNLLEANKKLSLSNNCLEDKIELLEKVIKQHEEKELLKLAEAARNDFNQNPLSAYSTSELKRELKRRKGKK